MWVGSGGVQWGPVGIGYVRPVQILDHLTVIKKRKHFALMTGLQNHRRNNDKREYDFETVDDDIDSYIDGNDITGETTTREKRKYEIGNTDIDV